MPPVHTILQLNWENSFSYSILGLLYWIWSQNIFCQVCSHNGSHGHPLCVSWHLLPGLNAGESSGSCDVLLQYWECLNCGQENGKVNTSCLNSGLLTRPKTVTPLPLSKFAFPQLVVSLSMKSAAYHYFLLFCFRLQLCTRHVIIVSFHGKSWSNMWYSCNYRPLFEQR